MAKPPNSHASNFIRFLPPENFCHKRAFFFSLSNSVIYSNLFYKVQEFLEGLRIGYMRSFFFSWYSQLFSGWRSTQSLFSHSCSFIIIKNAYRQTHSFRKRMSNGFVKSTWALKTLHLKYTNGFYTASVYYVHTTFYCVPTFTAI